MAIYKRGKTYWARAQRDGREFRASLKTTSRRDAESRYRKWLDDLDASAWGDRPRRTFDDAADRFIAEHCATLKPASARRYNVSLKMLTDAFAGRFLDEITRDKLSEYETFRRSGGTSAPTVRRDLACLSSMLTSCEEWDWIPEGSNPIPGYLKRRSKRGLKEAPPRTRYLSEDEEAKILAKASPAVRQAIMVAIDTGLRLEEQFSLAWPQVDFRRGIIATTRRTKNGRARSVPLPERSAQILAHLPRHQPRGKNAVASLYVFRHENGDRLNNMEKGFKAAARRAGIEDVRWHDLRRTAGCRWLQRDRRSMEEVCMLLGHSSVAVTETRYAFLEGEAVAQNTAQGTADYYRKAK